MIIDVRTDYKNPDYKDLCASTVNNAGTKSYDILKQAHIKDYSRLFNRVKLDLGTRHQQQYPHGCTLETDTNRKHGYQLRCPVFPIRPLSDNRLLP